MVIFVKHDNHIEFAFPKEDSFWEENLESLFILLFWIVHVLTQISDQLVKGVRGFSFIQILISDKFCDKLITVCDLGFTRGTGNLLPINLLTDLIFVPSLFTMHA